MTLIEILHEILPQLIAGHEQVVIARGDDDGLLDGRSEAFQMRLRPNDWSTSPPLCEARSWLGGQWGPWREQRGWLGAAGFDIRDVLATDWRILP